MKNYKKLLPLLMLSFGLFINIFGFDFFNGFKIRPSIAKASVDYNCYCNEGSLVPFYYPVKQKLNTADFDSCNQECANIGAKYFSFSTVSHAGTTLVSKTPLVPAQTTQQSVAASNGAMTDDVIPGTKVASSGLVQCGRPGQKMCTLCNLIEGMNRIIQYIMKISIVVGLAAFTLAGVMYILSGGGKMIETAKATMKNAAVGFVVIFSSWLIINYTMIVLGTRPGLGINVVSWGNFVCK